LKILYISGSPRQRKSNTDYLLNHARGLTGGSLIKLVDYRIAPCLSCWKCLRKGFCAIDDDMSREITPLLLEADGLVLGSPVYFNNVSAQMKTFIDRTWSLRGKLRNKAGGAVVVGRRYGAESAITAIHAFFLKHDMIPVNRGVSGEAFNPGEIKGDREALEGVTVLAKRLLEIGPLLAGAGASFKREA